MTEKNISVLLVEDSAADAQYARALMPSLFYTIRHAPTLALALTQLNENQNVFHVILLDLSLPDGTGLDTFRTMIKAAPTIPILILTGLDDEEISLQAVKLGAQDYILKKEISNYTLSRAIRHAIERKQHEMDSQRLVVLEQREEFMATLTHDLKNPLIGANTILQLMAEQAMGVVSEEQTKLLLQLRDNNKLLLFMIQNLIEVYRFEKDVSAVCLENTSIRNIVTACLADIAPIAANREIHLQTEFPEQVHNVLADPNSIRRVVQNLIDNALKFTPNGGEIKISICPVNGLVAFQVKDTGAGIPQEEQPRLFNRFSQGRIGRRYTPGTGLGLYLCKQIVDAHHGDISCSSIEGVGTTFTVTLPAA